MRTIRGNGTRTKKFRGQHVWAISGKNYKVKGGQK